MREQSQMRVEKHKTPGKKDSGLLSFLTNGEHS